MRVRAAALLAGLVLWTSAPHVRGDEGRGLQLSRGVTIGDDLVGRRTALCIGIDGYRHERYGPLRYAAADARALAQVLGANGYAVTLMVDGDPTLPPERVPTYRNLDDAIHRFCRASTSPNDTLLICFSGHGDVVAGQSVLLPLDHAEEERVLTIGALFDALGRAKAAKKLVVLDACRSARRDGARLLQAGFLASLAAPGEAIVLSGCGADQYSYEDEALGNGRLTRTLVDGLGGAAYREGQEFLFGFQLWAYVATTFRAKGWIQTQSPTMFGTWDARVRFDLARREVPPPPPPSGADRTLYDLAMRSAFDRVEGDDLTAGIEYCGTALRILPGDPDALALRAFSYGMLGFYGRAQQDVDAVLAADPDNVYALVLACFVGDALGDATVFQRNGLRALLLFRKDPERWVERLPPRLSSYVWLSYAVALIRLGRPAEEQLAALDRVLQGPGASPKAAGWAHTLRGDVLSVAGRAADALAEYDRALERAAGDAEVFANARARRGLVLLALGRMADGEQDLRWVREHPGGSPYAVGLAWLGTGMLAARQGNAEEALAAYAHVEEAGPLASDLQGVAALGRARILRELDRWPEAIEAYGKTLGSQGMLPETRAWALVERGAVRLWSRRYEEGLADVASAAALAGAPASVRGVAEAWRGLALQRLGRHDEAAEAFRRVVAMEGAPPEEVAAAGVRLAMCRWAAGDAKEARERLEPTLAGGALSPDLRALGEILLARIESRGGSPEGARSALARASAVQGVSPAFRRLVEMEGAALDPGARPPEGEDAAAAWSRVLFHLARGEWAQCERQVEAAQSRGPMPADAYWALDERWQEPGEPPETAVVHAWIRLGGSQDDDARRVLRAYVAVRPEGPLAARAARLLE